MPTCYIIAGPNGAGKTTFALDYLPAVNCHRFINADLIAAGLSPLAPEGEASTASRIFLQEIGQAIEAKGDFAFETTLSGRGHLRRIKSLRLQGWNVELIYLALLSVEDSRRRVAERVAHGGHDIPQDAITRRFPRSLHNLFHQYMDHAGSVRCLLNVYPEQRLIFEKIEEKLLIHDPEVFAMLEEESKK